MADLKISQLTGATTPLAGSEVVPLVQSSTTKKVAVSDLTAGREFAAKSMTLSGDSAYAQGKFFTTNGEGTMIACKTGTFFDGGLLAAGLTNYVWTVATGTNNIKFWSDVTLGNGGTNNHTLNGNLIQGTAAKGVNFTANTPAAGMTSQLLNDYQEGTWTPVITAGVGSFTTYTSQGLYTKVGRIVTAWCSFQITNVGTGNTFCTIAGYPFTSYNSAAPSQQAGVTLYRENNITGATGYTTLSANSTSGALFGTFGNNYTFEFVMVYQTA